MDNYVNFEAGIYARDRLTGIIQDITMELINYIKYCRDYANYSRRMVFAASKNDVMLLKENFKLPDFVSADIDSTKGMPIRLSTFCKNYPSNVPEDLREKYREEKEMANSIERLVNRAKNDEYTRQVVMDFGFLLLESPTNSEANSKEACDCINTISVGALHGRQGLDLMQGIVDENKKVSELKHSLKPENYPLFSLAVKLEKQTGEGGTYLIYRRGIEIQVNTNLLETVIGKELHDELQKEIKIFEADGLFSLPVRGKGMFTEIWQKVKAKLKLTNVRFDDTSFSFDDKVRLTLRTKPKYFLSEDLHQLTQKDEKDLKASALNAWIDNDNFDIENRREDK